MTSYNLGYQFFAAAAIAPQPPLAALRAFVLARSERRSPKWRFRIAPDLITQIQPKLSATGAERFECVAIMCEGATGEMLTTPWEKLNRADVWRMSFELRADATGTWTLKPASARWKMPRSARPYQSGNWTFYPANSREMVPGWHAGANRLRDRLIDVLQSKAASGPRIP